MTELRPAAFIDRAGTIILEREYLADPDGVEIIPGTFEALAALREAGFALIVVTNQSGIARGYYSIEDYRAVAARLDTLLDEAGVAWLDPTTNRAICALGDAVEVKVQGRDGGNARWELTLVRRG